jgi:N-methylhydantoinase A/acetone carboxylase beta subunit
VGAGTGSYVRINPTSNRIEIGPDSAGASIGVSWPEGGVDNLTITDCNVVLGYINPDFFLGGDITLDRDRAIAAVREQVAEHLGIDVYRAATGVLELFEDHLRSQLLSQILGKGYTPESYTLLSYGGGGPLHVAGYSDGLAFDDILVPAWAPGFSAFGCACGDYEYRYDRSLDMPLLPTSTDDDRKALAEAITDSWKRLRKQVEDEFAKSGVSPDKITYKPAVRMLYYGQLNDLEVVSDKDQLTGENLDQLCEAFEGVYGRIYGLGARTPQFGYMFTGVILSGSTEVERPVLPEEPLVGSDEREGSVKGHRNIYWEGEWVEAEIIDLEKLHAGNVIKGPAVVESPASTMLVPPGRTARLDEHRIFHVSVNAAAVTKAAAE